MVDEQWGRPPKNLDEVMLRAMRSAWAKKTSDLYERKIWTKAYTTKVLTRLTNDALAEHDIGAPNASSETKSRASHPTTSPA